MPLAFEWDPRKAKNNLVKHGIAFDEATTVFDDPLQLSSGTKIIPMRRTRNNRGSFAFGSLVVGELRGKLRWYCSDYQCS